MSTAIEDFDIWLREASLSRLAAFQEDVIKRYSAGIMDESLRASFARDLYHLIHLIYREAQAPLVEHIMTLVATMNRPVYFDPKGGGGGNYDGH